jgi:hypothetical protein
MVTHLITARGLMAELQLDPFHGSILREKLMAKPLLTSSRSGFIDQWCHVYKPFLERLVRTKWNVRVLLRPCLDHTSPRFTFLWNMQTILGAPPGPQQGPVCWGRGCIPDQLRSQSEAALLTPGCHERCQRPGWASTNWLRSNGGQASSISFSSPSTLPLCLETQAKNLRIL